MKKAMILGLAMLVSPAAFADGFRCETVEGDLNVAVYHETQPTRGTRNAAVMVLSDPAVSQGRKTIAKFTAVKGTLANSGATYVADVDLRVVESRTKGEYLLGTRLGYLDQIILDIEFNYGAPTVNGAELDGTLLAIKRDGKRIEREVICTRYLKN